MREEIESKAQELLQGLPSIKPMVQIGQICDNLGIRIEQSKNYAKGKDGHIQINEKGEVSIIINERKAAVRRRFTIAHEIAHFVIHRDYLEEHRVIDRDGDIIDFEYRGRELEANQFAANLLMPTNHFIKAWQALGAEPKIQDIADFFGVSKDATYYRALSLGLVSAS